MKRKVVALLLSIVMALGLTACGGEEAAGDAAQDTVNGGGTADEQVAEDSEELTADAEASEDTAEAEQESEEMELPGWKGVWRAWRTAVFDSSDWPNVVDLGSIQFRICYPSLKPNNTPTNWVYQKDPALVKVAAPPWGPLEEGRLTSDYMKVENLESFFEAAKKDLCDDMDSYRKAQYRDFDFVVESSELMTVGSWETCKFTGQHTYTKDDEPCSIPFVAYAVDINQVDEGYYIMVIVVDDSINYQGALEPLAEGTIEAYARKMVESIDPLEDGEAVFSY